MVPEVPFSFNSVLDKINEREKSGSKFTIIVVAEGAVEVGTQPIYMDQEALRLGGVGSHLRRRIEAATGKEARCVVLGHLQRGGSPNAFDRMLGTNFGACAVRALANGQTGKMVALKSGEVVTVPLSDALTDIKTVQVDG